MSRISGLAHCCHHDRHWEYCYDYQERVDYIKAHKPRGEQELRLKLFQIVPDDLLPGKDSPEWKARVKAGEARDKAREAYVKAGEAYVKTWEARDKAWKARVKAWTAYVKAREAYVKAWEARDKAREAYVKAWEAELSQLHARLFTDCPWNGKTIFASGGE